MIFGNTAIATMVLLHLSVTAVTGLRATPVATLVTRRQMLAIGAAAFAIAPQQRALAEEAAAASPITKMDAFQLKASYKGLTDALSAWNVEIAQVQLGNEPSSVVAVAGLSDGQLKHFAESSSKQSVSTFAQRRGDMLQNLYLARGSARYEKDPRVTVEYVAKARLAAEAARAELAAIAAAEGIELGSTK